MLLSVTNLKRLDDHLITESAGKNAHEPAQRPSRWALFSASSGSADGRAGFKWPRETWPPNKATTFPRPIQRASPRRGIRPAVDGGSSIAQNLVCPAPLNGAGRQHSDGCSWRCRAPARLPSFRRRGSRCAGGTTSCVRGSPGFRGGSRRAGSKSCAMHPAALARSGTLPLPGRTGR